MNKLEIYAIVVAVILATNIGIYFKGHHNGFQEAQDKQAAALLSANAKIDQLQGQLNQTVKEQANAIVALNAQREKDVEAARASVKPVIVRIPAEPAIASNQAGSTAGGAPGPGNGQQNLSMPVERDIGPALVMLAAECQRDRDARFAWQRFYESQAALINGN